ncbi:MAG: hypothetical protein CSA22_03040 [Deltaproteobacteria bacterium]|nr:MAG: hypothetical protein CSA22_03040 [Deltaproteobacteria bacterium]
MHSLYYLERYRNQGTRTYSKHAAYTEAEVRYRPDADTPPFFLDVFRMPLNTLSVYTANPSAALASLYLAADTGLLCIHPQVSGQVTDDPCLRRIRESGTPEAGILVTPSASTRTLYVQHPLPHALKVHFPFQISRYGRKMRAEVIEQAVAVSLDLEQGLHCFDKDFSYLREVIGIACLEPDVRAGRGENWGYIVRDMTPFPCVAPDRDLVPGFALYGRDFFDPNQPPLLFELMGDADPQVFILNKIMLPIVRHWVACYRNFGYMLEPHGQNTLLEVGRDGSITRIVHRDLSLGINMGLRADLGLLSEHLNRYNRMADGVFASITYDMFMGNHFFDRIVSCCLEQVHDLSVEDFRAPCRALFAELFPEHRAYMPDTVHYFSEQRDRFNKPFYQDTGMRPVWRP